MTAQKSSDTGSSRSSTASSTTLPEGTRKPWKKKTPVEVVLDQINRLRDDVTKKEEEFKAAKKQLEKLEQARKVLESS